MMKEIIWQLTEVKKTSEITSEHLLAWARRVEEWRAQKALMESIRTVNNLIPWKGMNKWIVHMTGQNQPKRETLINYKHYGNLDVPRRCPAYGKRCSRCDKANHFENVCRIQSRQITRDDNRWRAVHEVCKDSEETQVATQEFEAVR